MMKAAEILMGFTAALKAGDLEEASQYLSEDFQFRGPMPAPLDKRGFLRLLRSQKDSFPEWSLHIRCLYESEDRVIAQVRFLGQPSSQLLVAAQGKSSRPEPIGAFVAAPEEQHEYRLQGDQIAALEVRRARASIPSRFSIN